MLKEKMNNKKLYSITTEDDIVLAYCKYVDGLDKRITVTFEDNKCYKLILHEFQSTNKLDQLLSRKNELKSNQVGILYINILNYQGKIIGSYGIYGYEFMKVLSGVPPCAEIIHYESTMACPNATSIWNIWRNGYPKRKNRWKSLANVDKRAWVEVVRIAWSHSGRVVEDVKDGTVILDGKLIVDIPSFYCAIGEAVNGPGGYFGGDLWAFEDCLCGHFGIEPLFKLIWKDSEYSKRHLTGKVYYDEIVSINPKRNRIKITQSFFSIILEILEDNGVKLVLK